MSRVFVTSTAIAALTASIVGGAMALADVPHNVINNGGVIYHPAPSPVAQCAAGFSANPSTIKPTQQYNQYYTCTGPAIVCSPGFKAQNAVAGTVPGSGGSFGTTVYGSPVTIKNGRMVYTCAEPQTPPQ